MKSLLVIFLTATTVYALTEEEKEIASNALQNPDLFEGDIMGVIFDEDRNAIPYERKRWPEGRIPYVIDDKISKHKPLILSAMEEYHTKTCIRFIPRSIEENYLDIRPGKGCWSWVGFLNKGAQEVSLGKNCYFKGTIIHELGHAIGFYHEQSRSDRDNHLIIYRENIKEGQEDQFKKLTPEQNIIYNKFDYKSIMIYGNYAFSKDKKTKKTMLAKTGDPLLEPYEKAGMTASDAYRVNRLYNCPKTRL